MKLSAFLILVVYSVIVRGQADTTTKICSYPGGIVKVQEILKAHLVYPESAQKDKIVGRCYIKFTVDTLGNPTNIAVQKSLRGDCDSAAIEAVKYLTGWIPSQVKGKKVVANMSLPINFGR
jgi:protein TonB